MPAERFFTENPLLLHQELLLIDTEFHHLIHVMRAKEGDKIELVNGLGSLAQAHIEKIKKKGARLRITHVLNEPPPQSEMILAQAIPRLNRLDFILEKGTELGMTQIWLFPAQQGERKELTPHQLERMRAVTIAAMKQCGRLHLPKISIKTPLNQWKKPEQHAFYGDVDPAATCFKPTDIPIDIGAGVLFYIGPESGFSDEETKTLQKLGARGVKLNPNILRTDTAALTALSILCLYISLRER